MWRLSDDVSIVRMVYLTNVEHGPIGSQFPPSIFQQTPQKDGVYSRNTADLYGSIDFKVPFFGDYFKGMGLGSRRILRAL